MEPLTHEQWVREEGGVEHPTHLETLAQPCQIKRITWLKDNAVGSILELGCNRGAVLTKVTDRRDSCGVDINPKNIELAKKEYPHLDWRVMDMTINLPFGHDCYTTVMLPDVLEHIPKDKINFVLDEAARVSRYVVLITLPKSEKKRHCFKHCWLVENSDVFGIVDYLKNYFEYVHYFNDTDFYYIKARSKKWPR